jgi:hypothetical protein
LLNHYTVDISVENAGAFPTLLLFKSMFLQKSFHSRGLGFAFYKASIDFGPKLQNQIKVFLKQLLIKFF